MRRLLFLVVVVLATIGPGSRPSGHDLMRAAFGSGVKPSVASGPGTITLSYTGATQTWTVPGGITSVTVDMAGAAGGASTSPVHAGGLGGRLQATLPVTPGALVTVMVGGAGPSGVGSGFNGGGSGGFASSISSGCGGGASDARIGGTALTDRKLVAGGGGGGTGYASDGDGPGGNGGGTTGQAGQSVHDAAKNGGGGTPSAGGAAGNGLGQSPGSVNGNVGALGVGGDAGVGTVAGAGGGGGYYGGGGGGWASGANYGAGAGGGGSSYADPTATAVTHTQGFRAGNGYVTLTW